MPTPHHEYNGIPEKWQSWTGNAFLAPHGIIIKPGYLYLPDILDVDSISCAA